MRGKFSIHEGAEKRFENLTAKCEPKRSPRKPVYILTYLLHGAESFLRS